MTTERFIENNVIRNRDLLGYRDSLYIRRCRAGRGFGIVDVMILPLRGPHRLVLVEAKQIKSIDSSSKVIGQLLLYYSGALQFGARGVRMLRDFASKYPVRARSMSNKLLKTLSGGISPPDDAWREFQKGHKISPKQIGLFIALNGNPSEGLKSSLETLFEHHGLEIGIVSVHERDKLSIWKPA